MQPPRVCCVPVGPLPSRRGGTLRGFWPGREHVPDPGRGLDPHRQDGPIGLQR